MNKLIKRRLLIEKNDAILKKLLSLEDEYYILRKDWIEEKTFWKLDRKEEIEIVFENLGIELTNWEK